MQLVILFAIFIGLGFRTHDICTIFGMEKHPEESHRDSTSPASCSGLGK